MSFVGGNRLITATRGITALSLVRSAKKGLLLATNNTTGTSSVLQVRTATKKVAGSRTSMKDSAGRRLGAKVAENEPVKTGQILMRQRGTNFYPGENASIGKDHTIYATEPGYVRFYLDPFHPKRKFIGIALRQELRLPTPHFEPRVRRLGYIPITDANKAQFEENNLSRKAHLMRPDILKSLKEREEKRQIQLSQLSQQIREFVPELSEKEIQLASERLLSIRNHLKSGIALEEAQAITTSIFIQDSKLQQKRGSISADESELLVNGYKTLSQKVDTSVSFDNQSNLTSFISEADRNAKVAELTQQLQALVENREGIKTKKQIQDLIYGSNLITTMEKKRMISKFLKSVLAEPVGLADPKHKNVSILKRWNYQKRRVDTIARSKEAFAFQ